MPLPNMTRRRSLAALLALVCYAALPAHAQTSAPSKTQLTMEEARLKVLELPEVQAWKQEREREAEGQQGGPAAGGILTGVRSPKGSKAKHYAITFYKTPRTAPEKWNVFFVRASDGKIFVEDEKGGAIPLEDWRRRAAKGAG